LSDPVLKKSSLKEVWWSGLRCRPYLSSSPSTTKKKKKELLLRTGGMSQIVKHLPSKHKALSTTPSTTRKKEKIIVIVKLNASFLLGNSQIVQWFLLYY
jgi:hypothetical protein